MANPLAVPREGIPELPVTLSVDHWPINVFDHLLKLGITETAYVVGSGANGRLHAHRIAPAYWSVACNGAITLPAKFNAWAAFDREVLAMPYMASIPDGVCRIMGTNIAGQMADYAYDYAPSMTPDAGALHYGVLRAGGSIACCMLQLLYWAGVKHAILCGVDMFGNKYHDGHVSKYHQADKDWGMMKDNMQRAIDLCEAGGTKVSSISKTALDVKMI
jgi:hypothetical protein